jgi:phosphohistidine phosphatase SixA
MAHAPGLDTTVCLIRHGDAGEPVADPRRDRERRLTAKGRRQSALAGAALDRLGLRPRVVVTSRLARATETAAAALAAAGAKARTLRDDALEPHAPPEDAAEAIDAAWREAGPRRAGRRGRVVWMVGHDPHLSRLAAFWLAAGEAAVLLKKGAVAVLRCEGAPARGAARLTALWQPKDLKRLLAEPSRRRTGRR